VTITANNHGAGTPRPSIIPGDAAETHEKELLKTVHEEHEPDHDPQDREPPSLYLGYPLCFHYLLLSYWIRTLLLAFMSGMPIV
jgi:hypothetical protein